MINSSESKQDQSRHFGFKRKALGSHGLASSVDKETKRAGLKQPVQITSRHISRKDLFYRQQTARNALSLKPVKVFEASEKTGVSFWAQQNLSALDIIKVPQAMHPEQVQMSSAAEALGEDRSRKQQEVLEEEIDVLEVDNGDLNGGAKDELHGNGFLHKENGHSQLDKEKVEEYVEGRASADINSHNGSEVKSVLRLKSSRRNSTSSRSSSVSSAPSSKQQTPVAMRMEVSVDEEDRDHLDPLVMEVAAEDLEVSMSATHEDDGDEGATTDSEAVMEAVMDLNNDPYEFDDEASSDHTYESEMILKKAKSPRPAKSTKSPVKTKAEVKAVKSKIPRKKSLKLKGPKTPLKSLDKVDDGDNEYSDTNSLYKDDTESEELNIKPTKSPKRSKAISSKPDVTDDVEAELKSNESEHAPRRSSRSRQTPQKYNSSMYVDSYWDQHPVSDDRMNNSDAVFGASIRSVKGRRSLRKSRNISSLNSSLHNESSPWDTDLKVLTPSVGGVSAHTANPLEEIAESTPLKRKAEDEGDDDVSDRGQKKMCIENTELDASTSSQTSSFFSVITSPIVRLKNKLRGSSISCSTPIKDNDVAPNIEPEAVPEKEIVGDAQTEMIAETSATPTAPEAAPEAATEAAPEARSWCLIM